MRRPAVSVITPLFQSAGTLARCMASVEDSAVSTAVSVEGILVMDGPDQGVAAVVRDRPVVAGVTWRCIEIAHSGIAAARNCGLAAATASLFTLLDADDEMTPQRLEALPQIPVDGALIGTQELIRFDDAPIPGLRSRDAQRVAVHHIGTMIIHTELMRSIGGFDGGFTLGDDWDLMIRLKERGCRLEFVNDVFVRRHITGANASRDTKRLASDYVAAIRAHRRRSAVDSAS